MPNANSPIETAKLALEDLLQNAQEETDKIEIDSKANVISGKIERYRKAYGEDDFIRKYYRRTRDWYKSTKQ